MRRRISSNALIVVTAAAVALLLTFLRPAPEGILPAVGQREVRAAPGNPSSSVRAQHNLSALEIFSQTLIRIRDSYVDPTRIDPKEMLYGALDSVQFNIPEVLIEIDKAADRVSVVVNDKQRTFNTRTVASPWRLAGLLKKIMKFIEANMNPGADLAAVEYAAVNGMLATLDPHSVLLDPETAREMDVSTQGHFGGLGIVIQMRKQKLMVVRPMAGTPAQRAGLKAGDHIAKINDEITENLTLQEAVNRMRGKRKSKVTLWIERKDASGLLRFDLYRDLIMVPSVKHKLLSAGTPRKKVGYIKIEQFAGRTTKEVKQAMAALRKSGAMGWVVDLRGNPGGLLEQAIKVSDLFIDSGTLVTTVSGRERNARRAERGGSDTATPIAVLVNQGSASASEIVAGALKNLDRAVIVGTKTFGKGSVQILYDNEDDGSKLKLTIQQYLTPGDLSIQGLGIAPDIDLSRLFIANKNEGPKDYTRLLRPSRRHGEKDLKSSLSSTYAKKSAKSAEQLAYVYRPPNKPAGDDDELDPDTRADEANDTDEIVEDYEIKLARDIIAGAGRSSAKATLKGARAILSRRRGEEEARVVTSLQKLGVNWAAKPRQAAKPLLRATFDVLDPSGVPTTSARAGQTVKLRGTIENVGQTPAYRVLARVQADDGAFNDRELLFGKIEPGAKQSWITHVKLPDAAYDRYDRLDFNISAASQRVDKASLDLQIASALRPTFAYSHQLIDAGNGDGLVQKGEAYRLRVTVKNTGAGTAAETTAMLRNASGDMLKVDKARFVMGELKPGESKSVEFAFGTTKKARGNVVVEMSVFDTKLGESVRDKLKYRVRQPSAGPVASKGRAQAKQAIWVYEGASPTSNRVAVARKGAVFAVTGKLGKWLRVETAKGRSGFVSKRDIRATTRPSTLAFSPHWQVTPPTLEVTVPNYRVVGDRFRLQTKVTDDSNVADVYVFVSNRKAKVDNRKVFYKSNKHSKDKKTMNVGADIPLWPGSNLVTVIARENGEVKSARTLYLYRARGEAPKLARPSRVPGSK